MQSLCLFTFKENHQLTGIVWNGVTLTNPRQPQTKTSLVVSFYISQTGRVPVRGWIFPIKLPIIKVV